MSRALYNDDVLQACLDQISTKDAVQLARTSRYFTESCKQRIWKSIPSLLPLICLLPNDALSQGDHGVGVPVRSSVLSVWTF